VGSKPLVLAVGSHEPRKNHLALLHAAELVWREGDEFDLVMVGGNSWDTRRFDHLVDTMRRRGRRIVTLSGVDDEVIWDLYDIAAFSVFCSLNEGFGLPVAESLSHGTPVITSDFGSMRAIGEGNGAVLADPRDPRAVAEHMRTLLRDAEERARLRELARTRPEESWQHYADTLWRIAHPGPTPDSSAPVRKHMP
jgi:glycosyltransferase involved in cell wall biosynthesis